MFLTFQSQCEKKLLYIILHYEFIRVYLHKKTFTTQCIELQPFSGQKPWWNWYSTSVVNFCGVWRAQLAKSTLLTSMLCAPGIFSDLLKSVQMLKREWVRKETGSYRTYSSLVKLQPWFLSLWWDTCLWAELQPWFLSLRGRSAFGRTAILVPAFAVKYLPVANTLMNMMMI